MAYSSNTLSYVFGGPIEGSFKLWAYTTSDAHGIYQGAGYITDAALKGVSVADFVMVSNPATPGESGLQIVSAVSNGAATLANLPNA
jgi:hypothetical protein